jgi:hypothetical protein
VLGQALAIGPIFSAAFLLRVLQAKTVSGD